jgi:hypothetical protein
MAQTGTLFLKVNRLVQLKVGWDGKIPFVLYQGTPLVAAQPFAKRKA